MFNLVQLYKFSVEGKECIVPASSLIVAMNELESSGYFTYRFIRVLT